MAKDLEEPAHEKAVRHSHSDCDYIRRRSRHHRSRSVVDTVAEEHMHSNAILERQNFPDADRLAVLAMKRGSEPPISGWSLLAKCPEGRRL
ncbi:MAG: hypothetical protein AB7U75_11885 [Hyphomicrobiaceae bacterium]